MTGTGGSERYEGFTFLNEDAVELYVRAKAAGLQHTTLAALMLRKKLSVVTPLEIGSAAGEHGITLPADEAQGFHFENLAAIEALKAARAAGLTDADLAAWMRDGIRDVVRVEDVFNAVERRSARALDAAMQAEQAQRNAAAAADISDQLRVIAKQQAQLRAIENDAAGMNDLGIELQYAEMKDALAEMRRRLNEQAGRLRHILRSIPRPAEATPGVFDAKGGRLCLGDEVMVRGTAQRTRISKIVSTVAAGGRGVIECYSAEHGMCLLYGDEVRRA